MTTRPRAPSGAAGTGLCLGGAALIWSQGYEAALILKHNRNSAKIKLALRRLCHHGRRVSKRLSQPVNARLKYQLDRKLRLSELKRNEKHRHGTAPARWP